MEWWTRPHLIVRSITGQRDEALAFVRTNSVHRATESSYSMDQLEEWETGIRARSEAAKHHGAFVFDAVTKSLKHRQPHFSLKPIRMRAIRFLSDTLRKASSAQIPFIELNP